MVQLYWLCKTISMQLGKLKYQLSNLHKDIELSAIKGSGTDKSAPDRLSSKEPEVAPTCDAVVGCGDSGCMASQVAVCLWQTGAWSEFSAMRKTALRAARLSSGSSPLSHSESARGRPYSVLDLFRRAGACPRRNNKGSGMKARPLHN